MTQIADQSAGFPLTFFLAGVYTATFAASALFFFKFWKKTRRPFFFYFGLACCFISAERVAFNWMDPLRELNSWLYLLRCLAYLLIVRAALSANR